MSITVNKESKIILFKSERRNLMTRAFDLLAAFICPKCGGILKAYFETSEAIPVWKYEGVETEHHSRFHSFTVEGAQGMVSRRHDGSYDPVCSLKVFWALELKENILKWFEENLPESRIRSVAELARKAERGEVDGLTIVHDLCGSADTLLAYDPSKWDIPWDRAGESWEEFRKRKDAFIEAKLKALGCVVAEDKQNAKAC